MCYVFVSGWGRAMEQVQIREVWVRIDPQHWLLACLAWLGEGWLLL